MDYPDSEVCLVAEFMEARFEVVERKNLVLKRQFERLEKNFEDLSKFVRMKNSRPPIPGPPGKRGEKGDTGLQVRCKVEIFNLIKFCCLLNDPVFLNRDLTGFLE